MINDIGNINKNFIIKNNKNIAKNRKSDKEFKLNENRDVSNENVVKKENPVTLNNMGPVNFVKIKPKEVLSDVEVQRQEKIAKIKEKVQSGQYFKDVSSEDIAKSMLSDKSINIFN